MNNWPVEIKFRNAHLIIIIIIATFIIKEANIAVTFIIIIK